MTVNKNADPPASKSPASIAGLFSFPALVILLFTLGVVVIGWLYFHNYESDYRAEVDRQLLAIANLKIDDIERWRDERMGNAIATYRNHAFSDLTRRFLSNPSDLDAQLELQNWLTNLQSFYHYERVYLVDPEGNERLSVPFAFPAQAAPHLLAELPSVIESKQVQFWGFHQDFPDKPPHLGLLIPILDEQLSNQVLGVLVLRINPDNSLFPTIRSWPIPSQSGEALLIRREGDEVILLSDLRFSNNAPVNLHHPLARLDLVCVQAVLGRRGVIEGLDYRDQQVIAAVQPVPGTDWLLVAKINRAEVYSTIENRLWPALIGMGVLFLLAGLGLGRFWRHRQLDHMQELLDAAATLRQSERRLRNAQQIAQIGDWEIDLQNDGTYWSDEIYRCFGLEPGEIEPNFEKMSELTHPDDRAKLAMAIQQAIQQDDAFSLDYRVAHKNGQVFWVHNEAELTRDASGQPLKLIGTIQDISERKEREDTLRESEALLREIAAHFPHSYISIIDNDLTVGFTSGQEFSRLNLNPKDYVGLTLEQVFGEYTALIKEYYLRTFQGEETEFELFFNDQHQLYRTIPIYDPMGRVNRIMAVVENISERKQAEQSLLKNIERMQSLMNILQFDAKDMQELLDFGLDEAVRLTGSQLGFIDTYDEEQQEFRMKSWSKEVMAECAIPGAAMVFQLEKAGLWGEAIRQRKPVLLNDYGADHPHKKGYPDGHVHLKNFISTPVFVNDRITAVIGVANKEGDYDQTDILQLELLMDAVWKIVQKRQTEEDLRRARDEWERTFDTIPDLIALIDSDHRFLRVNKAMAERLGVPAQELAGATCYEAVHCQNNPPYFCPLARTLISGEEERAEVDEPMLGGLFDITTTPLHDEKGELIGCVHVARDISASKRAEEMLRESEERLRMALNATNDVVWDWDVIHNTQQWNEAGTVVFGWTEIVEQPQDAGWWVERVHPDDRQRVNDGLFSIVENPTSYHWQDEYRFLKTDGSYAQVLDRAYVLRNAEGVAVRMIGAMLDITERKLAEEEIRKALADNQTLLRELYHRTKNNMYVISSMLAYQGAILPDERFQQVILETENRIRAMALVHEMLYKTQSLSRIDFSAYLHELVGYLLESYDAASRKITVDWMLAPVELVIDSAVPCGLVVNELVTNAIKHAFPDGRSGQINISLASIGKNEVEIEIWDDGAGFPAGFDPKKATTMGLQIVRRTVEHQLSGKLDFRPTNGVHCRIRFRDITNHEPIGS